MREIITRILTYIVIASILLFAFLGPIAHCADYKLLDVGTVYIDYMNFNYNHEPFLAPKYVPTTSLDLHVDTGWLDNVVFVNMMVHSETDLTQYRLVGLQYRLGVHLSSYFDIFLDHFSQHILDDLSPTSNAYTSLGFRLYLIK